MRRLAVFASGSGTNFEAIATACERGEIPARVVLMVCDKPGAGVVQRAAGHGVEAFVFAPKEYASKADYEREIVRRLDQAGVELVCLAGYMRELTGRITGRIEKQKEVKKSSSLRGLKPYMGLVAIFFLALMVVQILFPGAKNTDLPDIEGENAIVQEMEAEDIFDSQFNPTNEEIIEYLATEVDNYEMILAGIY